GPHTWSAAIKIIESGVLPLDEICTHQYGLGDVQTALDQVADSAGSSVKVSLIPGLCTTRPAASPGDIARPRGLPASGATPARRGPLVSRRGRVPAGPDGPGGLAADHALS